MTCDEYRKILNELSPQQRKELCDEIFMGGIPEVEPMVTSFERYRSKNGLEHTIVFWISRNVPGSQIKTEEDRKSEAIYAAANYAKRAAETSATIIQHINGAQVVAGHSIHGGVNAFQITFTEVFQAAERQIQQDPKLSDDEKKSLLGKLRDLASNSYFANLATSAIWDGVKFLWQA